MPRPSTLYNAKVAEMNGFVREVLVAAIGTDLGPEKAAWEKWMVDLFGYSYVPPAEVEKPSYYEDVPTRVSAAASADHWSRLPVPVALEVEIQSHHSCFGAGTPVQTIDGPRPIEQLRFGDQVLTQNLEDRRAQVSAADRRLPQPAERNASNRAGNRNDRRDRHPSPVESRPRLGDGARAETG